MGQAIPTPGTGSAQRWQTARADGGEEPVYHSRLLDEQIRSTSVWGIGRHPTLTAITVRAVNTTGTTSAFRVM